MAALRTMSLRELAARVEAVGGLEAVYEELRRRRREYGPAALNDSDWHPPVDQPPAEQPAESQ